MRRYNSMRLIFIRSTISIRLVFCFSSFLLHQQKPNSYPVPSHFYFPSFVPAENQKKKLSNPKPPNFFFLCFINEDRIVLEQNLEATEYTENSNLKKIGQLEIFLCFSNELRQIVTRISFATIGALGSGGRWNIFFVGLFSRRFSRRQLQSTPFRRGRTSWRWIGRLLAGNESDGISFFGRLDTK